MTRQILVVDDEMSIQDLLKYTLSGEDYGVQTAGTALEALQKLEVAPVDLVIVDLLLPGINGLDLAEAIRLLDPGTPVILITAYGTPAFESIAVHPAISHYVHKPFDLGRLLDLVDRSISRRRGSGGGGSITSPTSRALAGSRRSPSSGFSWS